VNEKERFETLKQNMSMSLMELRAQQRRINLILMMQGVGFFLLILLIIVTVLSRLI
tara:strand:- start:156 stop:323 length:168 start_codon:yes stop_codon:yes gene_type:complete